MGFQNGANNLMMNYPIESQNQFNHSRGYSNEDASMATKFKKKNGRLV